MRLIYFYWDTNVKSLNKPKVLLCNTKEFQANHPLAWKCKFNLTIARFQFARFRCCIYLHIFVNRIPDFAKWNFPDASQK